MDYIDESYIMQIASRLALFQKKDKSLYTFRCPYCGDSQKNKLKTRGYLFAKGNKTLYYCHNCHKSCLFQTFLKDLDNNLYKEYQLEKFKGEYKVKKPILPKVTNRPKGWDLSSQEDDLLSKIMDRTDKLEQDHIAVKYLMDRKIPRDKWSRIYYLDDISKIVQLQPSYKDRIKGKESRLIFPYYNDGKLVAVTCRALEKNPIKYLTVKLNSEIPLIYGLEYIKMDKPIIVVEGPIDSLFLDNCVAVSGSSFKKILQYLPVQQMRVVLDNQPRNKEIVKEYNKVIKNNMNIFLWPSNVKQGSDINDLILEGWNKERIQEMIANNTYNGMEAEMRFILWKRS